ncbi:hypothetical protein EVAR_64769_1 [Eumeta japonica]|uniref:Uncharacterized protein n=1 Tax=Eumeta variegata TaxID=151549 RepID=A0A4C1Z9L0_EUMVA|nr:hypothetical protein EVAR_64769_1 [Eumeta japonica]
MAQPLPNAACTASSGFVSVYREEDVLTPKNDGIIVVDRDRKKSDRPKSLTKDSGSLPQEPAVSKTIVTNSLWRSIFEMSLLGRRLIRGGFKVGAFLVLEPFARRSTDIALRFEYRINRKTSIEPLFISDTNLPDYRKR